ncbi:MAG: hypothetical protein NZ891_03085, partial [bacterium]|nr:hypothetical protein [bacterium]MDW8163709.1 hypothetical protein [Candidatus Omnitrophota bacterium]
MEIRDRIKKFVEKIEKYERKIKENRKKQEIIWQNEKTKIPIILNKDYEEFKNYPEFNMKESFYEPEKMLYMQLKGVISYVSEYSDACPSIRFNFGTGFI